MIFDAMQRGFDTVTATMRETAKVPDDFIMDVMT